MMPANGGPHAWKHVLVVGDDPSTLSLVARILADYRVSTAHDGSEALAILCGTRPVDLLITDDLMPAMTGSELVSQARATRRDLAVLVMTDHGDTVSITEPAWWAAEAHIAKPFQMVTLLAAVEQLIGPAMLRSTS
jgi:CheY-like chemotaxis protein